MLAAVAPELTGVRAAVNPDCTVSVRMTLGNRDTLRPDDALLVYLDTEKPGDSTVWVISLDGASRRQVAVFDKGVRPLALRGSLLATLALAAVGSLVAASDAVESYPLAEGQFMR